MAKVTSTAEYYPDSQVVSPAVIQNRANLAAVQSAPNLASTAVAKAKSLFPFLAGGFVILGAMKIVYEKFVVKDPGELRGPKIGLYTFIVVGTMAMVFALGVQTVSAFWSKVQSNMQQAANMPSGG